MTAVPERLRAVDWLVGGYAVVVAAVVLTRAGSLPGWPWLLTAHLLILLLIALVTRPGLGAAGRLLRDIYPIVLLLAFYSELDLLNAGRPVHDTLVLGWEEALFGGQPSRDWWRAAPSASWSFILHAAYLMYYPVVALPPLWLALRRDTAALRRFVLAVMAAFIPCYLFFLFLPVAGPYYTFPRPDGEFVANAAARLVYAVLAEGSSYGAAFPSSHVAATVAALVAGWHASRRLGLLLLVPTVLLFVAVVYCQMHYAVDGIAGLVVGTAAGAAAIAGAHMPSGRPASAARSNHP